MLSTRAIASSRPAGGVTSRPGAGSGAGGVFATALDAAATAAANAPARPAQEPAQQPAPASLFAISREPADGGSAETLAPGGGEAAAASATASPPTQPADIASPGNAALRAILQRLRACPSMVPEPGVVAGLAGPPGAPHMAGTASADPQAPQSSGSRRRHAREGGEAATIVLPQAMAAVLVAATAEPEARAPAAAIATAMPIAQRDASASSARSVVRSLPAAGNAGADPPSPAPAPDAVVAAAIPATVSVDQATVPAAIREPRPAIDTAAGNTEDVAAAAASSSPPGGPVAPLMLAPQANAYDAAAPRSLATRQYPASVQAHTTAPVISTSAAATIAGASTPLPADPTAGAPVAYAADTAAPHNLAEQFTHQMIQSLETGNHDIVLKLHPPELGDLSVRILVSGRDVSAWFASPQPQIQLAIGQGMAQLHSGLANAGYSLTGAWVGGEAWTPPGREGKPPMPHQPRGLAATEPIDEPPGAGPAAAGLGVSIYV
jgi:flagellar hook-length control protein FliK